MVAKSYSLGSAKTRWRLAVASVFVVGCVGGFAGAQMQALWSGKAAARAALAGSAPQARHQVVEPSVVAADAVAEPSGEAPVAVNPVSGAQVSDALVARLDDERKERERLGLEIQQIRATLAALEQRLGTVNAANVAPANDDEESEAETRRSRRVDAERLLEAGFGEEDAAFIAQRWGDQQMALLRLRDRAQREGWLGDERYEEALRSVRRGEDSLRGLLDEHEYDRFLFGTGRTNRVRVEQVIEGSPAQQLGLGPDDVLLRYNDTPVYGYDDLRTAIGSEEVDETAILEVERDGALIEFEVPRGPIGVQLRDVSVEP